MPAPRLVRLPAPHHDRRAFPQGRPSVHETLVAARRAAAHHADSLELVDDLGDREQGGHRTERQPAEIHVDPTPRWSPRSARSLAATTIPSSRNCTSSTATTSVSDRTARITPSAQSTGSASTVPPSCVLTE